MIKHGLCYLDSKMFSVLYLTVCSGDMFILPSTEKAGGLGTY